MINPEDKKIIISIIKRHVPKCKIYLFGSRARKTHSPGSDIDIAIDANKKIDSYVLSNICEQIEESQIPFCVDILDLHEVSDDMKKQILQGKILWKNQ